METQEVLDLTQWCEGVLEGTISRADQERLEQRLKASEECRQFYIRYMNLSASLCSYGQEMLSEGAWREERGDKKWKRWVGAACAVVAIGIGIALYGESSPSVEREMSMEWQVLKSDVGGYEVGEIHGEKKIAWDEGRMKFRLSSGAIVEAVGPVSMELVDPMKLCVNRGSVTADVGDEANGFVIEANQARVVDLGTRFGVSVEEGGETQVVVFDGEVELYDKSLGKNTLVMDLTEGEAVKFQAGKKIERLSSVVVSNDRMVLLGNRARKGQLVKSVTDNMPDIGVKKFYSITPKGMRAGVRSYPMVRKPRWEPLVGGEFPQELVGADLVGTFMRDRYDLKHEIKMDVTSPCRVYVLFDVRSELPDWLVNGFQDTGKRIRSGPWHPESPVIKGVEPDEEGRYYLTYSVWSMDVAGAGEVVVGSSKVKGDSSSHAMYGVAVKALSEDRKDIEANRVKE